MKNHNSLNLMFSIIMPVYNTGRIWLEKAIHSVLQQSYENWELCIVDDGSTENHIKEILNQYSDNNNKIKVRYLNENSGIAAATNESVAMASGDYLAFLDHDDELTHNALAEVAGIINEDPDVDVLYSDQDKITKDGTRIEPFYKPDWSPDFLRGVMYVGHLLVVKKSLAITAGLLNKEYDGLQDYEFMLRLSEHTSNIRHIPKILYHWRQIKGSIADHPDSKGNINELHQRAVHMHMNRLKLTGYALNTGMPHRLKLYPDKKVSYPLVSIIIPTKNAPELLEQCLKSVFTNTTYPEYEVILIDNDTTDKRALECMALFPVKIIHFSDPFNYSAANNLGVADATGEYVIFLNNDIEIVTHDWIQNCLFYAEQPDIGAVGPLLIYPDGRVQHAGVVLGFRGTADHIMKNYPYDSDGYYGSLCCAREVSAVTGACLMTHKALFKKVGCFNTHFATHYQDVDLCLKYRDLGYRNIYTPTAVIKHHESASRGNEYDLIDRALLLDQWGEVIEAGDPYYNPNFDILRFGNGETGYSFIKEDL